MLYLPPEEMLKRNGYYIKYQINQILKEEFWRHVLTPLIIKHYKLNLFRDIYLLNISIQTLNGRNRQKLRSQEIKFLHIYFTYDYLINLSNTKFTKLNDDELLFVKELIKLKK